MNKPHVRRGRPENGSAATNSWFAVIYLLFSVPLSLFLYLETTPEAASFFAGFTAAWWLRASVIAGVVGVLAGAMMLWRLPFKGSRPASVLWLAFSAGLAVAFRPDSAAWDSTAAVGLCVPGWIGMIAWIPQLWRAAAKPIGKVEVWMKFVLLLTSAVVISFLASASFLIAVFPQLQSSVGGRILLAARAGGLAGAATLLLLPILWILLRGLAAAGCTGRSMLLLLGVALEAAVTLILLNGLRYVGGMFVNLFSGCYIVGLTLPAVVLFCRRAAHLKGDLGQALLVYARPQHSALLTLNSALPHGVHPLGCSPEPSPFSDFGFRISDFGFPPSALLPSPLKNFVENFVENFRIWLPKPATIEVPHKRRSLRELWSALPFAHPHGVHPLGCSAFSAFGFLISAFGFPLLWLAALAAILWTCGCAHLYYEWGFATAVVYSALGIWGTWLLFTMLPSRIQSVLCASSLAVVALGLASFAPCFQSNLPWNAYLRFDKNFGSVVHAWYLRHPSREPALCRARQLLKASHVDQELDLTQIRRQQLDLQPASRRPNVFFIVADALRGETYGASALQCGTYPGLAWMASRFTSYANAWTSYNSTRGSYPAYLNGRMQPAWYEYFWSYPVRQDNILSRACNLADYRCYNFATFSEDFSPCWPTNTCVALRQGGQGLGDPGIVFPQAIDLLDDHRARHPEQPAFFYLHLFNMHQPLFRRPGLPSRSHDLYFMRALYDQNVAYFDAQLLAFLQNLEQRGVLENSMIVICADHGEELFDFGGVYHGWQINPWVMHVPLFIHYPKCNSPGAQVLDRPVNLIDLAPTICDTMGVKIQRDSCWQGVSLLEAEPAEPRSFLLLSWKNPIVGQICFNPTRMLVLDLNSGEEQIFTPTPDGWAYNAPSSFRALHSAFDSPPGLHSSFSILHSAFNAPALADQINQRLTDLFGYWQTEPVKSTKFRVQNDEPLDLARSSPILAHH